jgi:hypothetical protein
LLLVLALLPQQIMIAGQTEVLQASALLLQSVVAAVAIGATVVVRVRCHHVPKSQVQTVVPVAVLVVVYHILLVETL